MVTRCWLRFRRQIVDLTQRGSAGYRSSPPIDRIASVSRRSFLALGAGRPGHGRCQRRAAEWCAAADRCSSSKCVYASKVVMDLRVMCELPSERRRPRAPQGETLSVASMRVTMRTKELQIEPERRLTQRTLRSEMNLKTTWIRTANLFSA